AATLQTARGAFDPQIQWSQVSKTLGGKPYYEGEQWQLQSYTRWAVAWESGFERMLGDAANPAQSTPDQGFYYQGLSMPLLRDLVTDYRRTGLQKAKIAQAASAWERNDQINSLLSEVFLDYIDWTQSWEQLQQANLALTLSQNRLEGMRILFEQGSCNALDTLEAFSQFAAYASKQAEYSYKEAKGRIMLSRHLWINDVPYLLRDDAEPESQHLDQLSNWVDLVRNQISSDSTWYNLHPQLALAQLKIDSKNWELKYWRNEMLPQLDLKYQWLGSNWNSFPNSLQTPDNQRFGLYFQSPLFLRSARGQIQSARTELAQLSWQYDQKQRDVLAKQLALSQGVDRYQEAYRWSAQQAESLQKLYEAEWEKFQAGDVQFFILNTRESRFVQSAISQWDAWAAYRQSEVALLFQSGLLPALL
ncbi:MAG: TolC family protein, partial [Bacteroidia bacterium]